MPSSAETAWATEVWKWPLIGQPGGRQRDGHVDHAVGADIDRAHHVELDDRAVQLGVDHDLQRLADLVCAGHAAHCDKPGWGCRASRVDRVSDSAGWTGIRWLTDIKDPRAVGAARGSREERVLLLPAGYEAGRLSACGPLQAGRGSSLRSDQAQDPLLDLAGQLGDAVGEIRDQLGDAVRQIAAALDDSIATLLEL